MAENSPEVFSLLKGAYRNGRAYNLSNFDKYFDYN